MARLGVRLETGPQFTPKDMLELASLQRRGGMRLSGCLRVGAPMP